MLLFPGWLIFNFKITNESFPAIYIGLWRFCQAGASSKFHRTSKRCLYSWCYCCFRLHARYHWFLFYLWVFHHNNTVLISLELQEKLDMELWVKHLHASYPSFLCEEIISMKNHSWERCLRWEREHILIRTHSWSAYVVVFAFSWEFFLSFYMKVLPRRSWNDQKRSSCWMLGPLSRACCYIETVLRRRHWWWRGRQYKLFIVRYNFPLLKM